MIDAYGYIASHVRVNGESCASVEDGDEVITMILPRTRPQFHHEDSVNLIRSLFAATMGGCKDSACSASPADYR